MKILDDLVSALDIEPEVRDIRSGPFQTAVVTRGCGLASTPHDYTGHQDHPLVEEAGNLMNKGTHGLVQMAYSASELEAAIGMAAINSLLDVDESQCTELNAADLIAEKGRGKRVVLVGHFPFVPRLRQVASQLWVIERRPREGDSAENEADGLLPSADVVGITGTAFTNGTIDHLLGLCSPTAYVVVLGGTTPLSPVLFHYGVDAISGTKVVDAQSVLRCVSQGATFRQIKGVRLLTMQR
jgi:uncharacterized protein (DUF4213/DUF364 family)